MPLSVAELAAAIGCPPPATGADAQVTAVVIDSRAVVPGAVFVAFAGEHVDGHDYVDQAWQRGAVAAVTARPVSGGPCLVVPDPQAALGQIGAEVVRRARRTGLRVVGITGSQGKTSTKDLLAQVLEADGSTIAPRGSLNNEIGVPLTATGVEPSTRYLVSEMGARGVGHIAYLCQLTPPDVGVVLNVGHAHLGEFGSQQRIALAKGELVEALPADGTAVLNADDPLVSAMRNRTRARVLTFSTQDPSADVWAGDAAGDDLGRYSFTLHAGDRRAEVRLRLLGRHQVPNAVAAAVAATALGVDLDRIASALSAAGLRSRWRMEISERPDGVVVVNDAYNANPDSMLAALQTLAELGHSRRRRYPQARTWAVLGEMLELGDGSEAEHRAIGAAAAALGISRVVVIGDAARGISVGAGRPDARDGAGPGLSGEEALFVHDKAAAVPVLVERLREGDIVLVKASRGVGLETVADALLAASAVEASR
ncbi:UDP-N-acetylmuramoyl-tripeptide--D-alanyl-D-alanine ligase [Microlunatus panaciterrae]